MLHLCKPINTFYRDHPKKPTATSPPIDSALPMAKPTTKPTTRAKASNTKQKQGRPAKNNGTSKHAKRIWNSSFLCRFWPCLDGRQKILSVTWSPTPQFNFSIFTYLLVFPLRYWLGGFFYQLPRSFGFSLLVPQRVGGFSLIDSPVFVHYFQLEF